jgi:AT-rich interactive domain-containing protein 1
VSELNALIQDLSQTAGNPGSSSGLSSNRLTNLNSAFEKLIGDLDGGASSAGSSAASTDGSASSTGGSVSSAGSSASSGSAAASGQSTSALQSFLTNFLQDLQANGAHSLSSVGSSVNTTA